MSAVLRDAFAKLAQIDTRISKAEREQREASRQVADARRLEEQHAIRQHQIRVDEALEPWATRAPPPVEGQSLRSYRQNMLELARRKLPEDHQLRRVDPYGIADNATLRIFEDQIFPAAKAAATDPSTVPEGQYREIKEQDASGRSVTKFIGPTSFIHEFTSPGRHVTLNRGLADEYQRRPFYRQLVAQALSPILGR